MLKFIILAAVAYFFYRALKRYITPTEVGYQPPPPASVDDEMIRDPVCSVYFPRKDGVALDLGGQTIYFCSEACRDKYVRDNAAT